MTEAALRYPGAFLSALAAKPAVIMSGSGRAMSYAELDAYACRLARLYHSLGLVHGDHVAYCLENRLECPAALWGAHYAGLYFSFVSTRLTAREAAYIVGDCAAKVVVLSAQTAPAIVDAIRALPHSPLIYSLDSGSELPVLTEAMRGFEATPMAGALEGSEMLYSSGTTGLPKGVKPACSGKPLGATALIADLMASAFGIGQDSIYLSTAPFYHTAPLKWSQGIGCLGGTVVIMEKFDAAEALRAIERYRVTDSQWVPTMFNRLLSLPDEIKAAFDLSSHRMAVHAAAPCPVPIKRAMIAWWGPIIFEYYGATELIGMTVTNSAEWLAHPGTVGRPIFGVPHIVDDEGRELPVGEVGTIYFANGRPFSYHGDEAKTRDAHNARGWATTGDVGRLDADGFLYLTDRKNNMIISGGVNVYPQETENVLVTHPKVYDVAVIGTPHEDFGEEVRAVVQLEPGIAASEELARELIAYCREQLSPIKCPRVVDFRDSLPREPNGKLLKRLLRDEYRAKHVAAVCLAR